MRLRTLGAVLGALLVVLATAVAGIYLVVDWRTDRSYYSSYEYEVELSTTEPLRNVTLYLPVPVANDAPLVANATLVADDSYPWLDARVNATHAASVVDTERGPMLAVRADELVAPERYAVHYFDEDGSLDRWEVVGAADRPEPSPTVRVRPFPTVYELYASVTVPERIDTRDPVANAAVLSPTGAVTEAACEGPHVGRDQTCFTVESAAYAEYDATDTAAVDLRVELTGWNEYGFGLANSYNRYGERVEATSVGGQDGWLPLRGELETGVGNYRDSVAPIRAVGGPAGESVGVDVGGAGVFLPPAADRGPCAPQF
jgi:hypothetical protein